MIHVSMFCAHDMDQFPQHHFLACGIIKDVASKLELPQDVVLTSQTLYHRFYIR